MTNSAAEMVGNSSSDMMKAVVIAIIPARLEEAPCRRTADLAGAAEDEGTRAHRAGDDILISAW